MSEIEVKCPSGLTGIVRGLKGREIDLFANQQEMRKRRVGTKILQACWIETVQLGPAYPNLDPAKLDWNKVLTADRFYAALRVRMATYRDQVDREKPAKYIFPHQCNDAGCRKKFEWELDLEDLPVKPLPDASIMAFVAGNKFTTTVGGRLVTYKLTTGADEGVALDARDRSPEKRATAALRSRVVSVSDVEFEDTHAWIEDLDAGDAFDLISAMERDDGGVETDIDIECPHCGNLMTVDLPLGDAFWTPRRRAK